MELKSLLMKVKVESVKVGLKLNIQKMKIMDGAFFKNTHAQAAHPDSWVMWTFLLSSFLPPSQPEVCVQAQAPDT